MIIQKNKLVLGIAQLGMKYGLNNTHGQPAKEESFSILDAALFAGINTFDTAHAYGTAEDILGEWIQSRSLADKVHIISKMKPHALNDYPDGTKAIDVVLAELGKSLKRLNIKSLDGYLFHSPHYIYLIHMIEGMQKAKKDGLVKNIGVSTYDEAEALQAVESGIDYVQIPYNAFDQRLDATDFFEIAKKNKVTVFARSPFLQGLLLMQPNKLPPHLVSMRPQLEQFIVIAKHRNLTQAEAALLFVRTACRADHIVFGGETLEQLEENIGIMKNSATTDADWIVEMKEAFRDFNRGAINPSLWGRTNVPRLNH